MKVHAQGFGKSVEPDAIKAGDLFTASANGEQVLCLSFEAKDQPMALIVRTDGSGSKANPEAQPIADLEGPFTRLKGGFAVRPIAPKPGETMDFPSYVSSGSGDLVITEDGDLYIAVEGDAEGLPERYLVDLSSGEVVAKERKSAARYSNWELVSLQESGHQDILAQFKGDAALLGDDD